MKVNQAQSRPDCVPSSIWFMTRICARKLPSLRDIFVGFAGCPITELSYSWTKCLFGFLRRSLLAPCLHLLRPDGSIRAQPSFMTWSKNEIQSRWMARNILSFYWSGVSDRRYVFQTITLHNVRFRITKVKRSQLLPLRSRIAVESSIECNVLNRSFYQILD